MTLKKDMIFKKLKLCNFPFVCLHGAMKRNWGEGFLPALLLTMLSFPDPFSIILAHYKFSLKELKSAYILYQVLLSIS